MKIDSLTLMLGVDILIPDFPVKIHQPTMAEIALIGEERFFYSLNTFNIDLDKVKEVFKNHYTGEKDVLSLVEDLTEFDVFFQFLQVDKDFYNNFFTLCALLFPNYEVLLLPDKIVIKELTSEQEYSWNENFYLTLKSIIGQIFKIDKLTENSSLNPKGELAERIASKMRKTREKIEKTKQEKKDINIFSQYISVLSIGTNSININELKNMTVYQLFNQIERFKLYEQYNYEVQVAMTGTKVDIVDWSKTI